ncbi:hypothetical protein [Streptomyces sp. NPDC004232]|uniref:hypothetical protein n=1 Tax=unclassified Streptomyces TaxID=2593676 RepID=UPI001DF7F63D|nr:hypothetical protein [Streptomyces sp. tea 10]
MTPPAPRAPARWVRGGAAGSGPYKNVDQKSGLPLGIQNMGTSRGGTAASGRLRPL